MKVVLCPTQHKKVKCERDGVCKVVRDSGADMCSVYVGWLDKVLNC